MPLFEAAKRSALVLLAPAEVKLPIPPPKALLEPLKESPAAEAARLGGPMELPVR